MAYADDAYQFLETVRQTALTNPIYGHVQWLATGEIGISIHPLIVTSILFFIQHNNMLIQNVLY